MKKELDSTWLQDKMVRGVLTRGRLCDNNKSSWGLLEHSAFQDNNEVVFNA